MRRFLISSVVALSAITATSAIAEPKDPIQIVVSLSEQSLRVYRGQEQIATSRISSGKKGHATPTGIFSVLQKNRHHRSNIYSGAPMPFMQRLTWSGIALHASNSVPSHPASHGCIRLPHAFAGKLFKMPTNGMHVIIEDDPQLPERIEHKALFQPKTTWQISAKYDGWVNTHIEQTNKGFRFSDEHYPARIFITRRTHTDDLFEVQRLLNKLGFEAGEVDGIMGPTTWKAISAYQSANDQSGDGKIDNVLISSLYHAAREVRPANGKLSVRKHHRTVLEAEVNINEPEKPLGSHLLTVARYDKKAEKTDWMVMSLNDRIQTKIHLRNGKQIDQSTGRMSAEEAFSRIEMSDHDREQVSRLLAAGSSITISDNGQSIETGAKGTDFIVLSDPENGISEVASGLVEIAG